MTAEPAAAHTESEVFHFGGAGTVLLISLVAFVGLYPLLMGGIAARFAGGCIMTVVLIFAAVTANKSRALRLTAVGLAVASVGLQVTWLSTEHIAVEIVYSVVLGTFFFYTALVIFRQVLSFGPIYADRVHAALSVYILLALGWACIYAFIEILSPGAFSVVAMPAEILARPQGPLFGNMIHLSITTLTSTGFGDITPVAPFARSLNHLEQLLGAVYVAVLISRLVTIHPKATSISDPSIGAGMSC